MPSMDEAPAHANNETKDDGRQPPADSRQRQPSTAWYGGNVRQPEAAEVGIKQKWEQCGYDRWKIYLVKLLPGYIFICTLQCSLVNSIFSFFLAGCVLSGRLRMNLLASTKEERRK